MELVTTNHSQRNASYMRETYCARALHAATINCEWVIELRETDTWQEKNLVTLYHRLVSDRITLGDAVTRITNFEVMRKEHKDELLAEVYDAISDLQAAERQVSQWLDELGE